MLHDAPIWVLILLAIAMWLIWAVTTALARLDGAPSMITNRKAGDVSAPQGAEVEHAQSEAQEAARGHAAATVHRLPAPGDRGHEVAGRPPAGSARGRAAHGGEHRAGARVVPVVQEAMQPVSGREGRRGHDEQGEEDRAAADQLQGPAPLGVIE